MTMKSRLTPNSILLLSLGLSILLILIMFGLFSQKDLDFLFSSDTLYLPSIYKDIFIDGNSLQGWELNPAPNFFPDMGLYFCLHYIFGEHFILTALIYAITQYFIILFLCFKILRCLLTVAQTKLFLAYGNIILCLFFVYFIIEREISIPFQLISNSFHLGAFFNILLITWLSILYIKTKIAIYLPIVFITSLLGSFSDTLLTFHILGLAVLLLLSNLFLLRVKISKFHWILLTVILISTITGYLLLKNIPSDYIRFGTPYSFDLSFDNIAFSFQKLYNHILFIMKQGWLGSLLIIIFLGSNILLTHVVFHGVRSKRDDKLFYLLTGVFLFNSMAFVLPLISGSYMGFDCIRYNIAAYITSFLVLPLLFSQILKAKHFSFVITGSFIVFLVIGLVHINSIGNIRNNISYYPKEVQEIDQAKKKYNLKRGVGHYWKAKYSMMFSQNNLRVYSVHNSLGKYEHVTNQNWFHYNPFDKNIPFNFVLFQDEEDLRFIKKRLVIKKLLYFDKINIAITNDFEYKVGENFPTLIE